MGKHDSGYKRVERDYYPTPSWVVDRLGEYVELAGMKVWEPACGDGRMVAALRAAGCSHVYASDIEDRANGQFEVRDFFSVKVPFEKDFDLLCSNPPFGFGGRKAVRFIETGLRHFTRHGQVMALLLPCDFDSAKTRKHLFRDCPEFVGKIVLTERVVWYNRTDGGREEPKENSAWFVWMCSPLSFPRRPLVLYSPRQLPC